MYVVSIDNQSTKIIPSFRTVGLMFFHKSYGSTLQLYPVFMVNDYVISCHLFSLI